MKTSFRLALASAALLAAAVPFDALAQGARPAAPAGTAKPAAAAPHKVGLVDMSHVFTNYQKLKDMREGLQKEFEGSSEKAKGIEAQIKAIAEELKAGTITKGSEQWMAKETEFTTLQAQLQAEMSNLKREFVRKEVSMYKDVHAEVSQYISLYAKTYDYTLILRYQRDTESADDGAEDPSKVMNRINQLVVYHQPSDDLTDTLTAVLNKEYAKANGRPAGTAAAGARQPR